MVLCFLVFSYLCVMFSLQVINRKFLLQKNSVVEKIFLLGYKELRSNTGLKILSTLIVAFIGAVFFLTGKIKDVDLKEVTKFIEIFEKELLKKIGSLKK